MDHICLTLLLFLQMTEMALAHKNTAYFSPIGFWGWLGNGCYGKSMQTEGEKTKDTKRVFWWEGGLILECGEKAVDVLFVFCSSERNLITP